MPEISKCPECKGSRKICKHGIPFKYHKQRGEEGDHFNCDGCNAYVPCPRCGKGAISEALDELEMAGNMLKFTVVEQLEPSIRRARAALDRFSSVVSKCFPEK